MSHSQNTLVREPLPAPPMKIHWVSRKVIPPTQPQWGTYNKSTMGQSLVNEGPRRGSDSLLVAKVDGKAVGVGTGVLYSAINGSLTTTGNQVTANDPQVKKLVYNMYRGLLSTKHEKANNIVGAAPQEKVVTDQGVEQRVVSMMRHQAELREGKMMNLGPPPPPPPPPFSTGPPAPAPKPPAEVPSKATPPTIAPPAALAGAMLKDKKPFTYTPGGINLAEINAQSATQQNGNPSSAHHTVRSDPIQSKSFKVIAGAYDNHDSAGNLTQNAVPEPKKYTGSNIPSRSFRMLQAMTDTDDGPGPGPGESDL